MNKQKTLNTSRGAKRPGGEITKGWNVQLPYDVVTDITWLESSFMDAAVFLM